jgi:putative methionine-R-sulfoxide reductase with GAF domain
MTSSQIFVLVFNSLALVVTLSAMMLVIFQGNWRTGIGPALFQFLGSLTILQGGTLLVHTGLLADLSDAWVEALLNVTLIGFFLVALTASALLLHAANTMKEVWVVIARSGVVALVVLQPALWSHNLFRLSRPLDDQLMGSPYTGLGQLMVGVCAAYVGLALYVGWRYRAQIDAPRLAGPVMGVAAIQIATMVSGTLREIALIGAAGGTASALLGSYLVEHQGLDPRTHRAPWIQAVCAIPQLIGSSQSFEQKLTSLAEQARRLVRADTVCIMRTIDSNWLEIAAATGSNTTLAGRRIRVGEGMAGRVMQTLSPMRVDNYHIWSGRVFDLDDVPIYASISVPLVYDGRVVGVMNAHETSPGRTFTNRDQSILEMLSPQAAVTLAAAHLQDDLRITQTYFRSVMDHATSAMMIFDSSGTMRALNSAAQQYLYILFGEQADPITVTQLAATAHGEQVMHALAKWMADPALISTLDSEYPSLGRLIIDLRTISSERTESPALLLIMRQPDPGL